VSLLFDFATRNLQFATNFYHSVAKWRLNDFVNFEPWASTILAGEQAPLNETSHSIDAAVLPYQNLIS